MLYIIKKPIKKHAKLETTSKTTTKQCHTSRTKLVDHVPITNNQNSRSMDLPIGN